MTRLLACVPALLVLSGVSGCVVVADDDGDSLASASATDSGTDGGSGGTSDGSAGPGTEGGPSSGDPSTSGSPTSAGSASEGTSGVGTTDATATGSAEGSTGSGNSGGDQGGGTIDVTLTGCEVDLGGTVVVSYNGSLGVASVYDGGATLTGSFQFDLDGTGVYALSSQHRVDTGTVLNLVDVAQGTWTNLDSEALTGGVDTIGGTMTVHAWDPASGVSDIELDGVSLLNVVDGNVCTIDGTIVTTQLYP